jgi:hypothetical protein
MQLVLFNKDANGWVTEKPEKHPNSDLVWLVVSNMNGLMFHNIWDNPSH